ncbi:DDE Tnp IS1595 domain-containing protein [Aphis craccivora]|uniref:DDE Tnp IS1595 domain-containing protein n=1 Tax=Aphis craccivora TaxID=307492 RepID=A0A6G0Z780_APHCR|nr:DDE Tnp IS1595 domain-containing protein [Aphis craccivora]
MLDRVSSLSSRERIVESTEDNAPCHKCNTEMQIKRRKCRNGEWTAIFRCPKRGCRTTRSARADSRFFHFTDLNQRCNKRECEAGSEIHSDEWAAYGCLTSRGFVHKTVNHQISYVDANTGAHTQNIERSWLDAKIKLLNKMRGVPLHHLQSYLDHYYWRLYRQDRSNLFLTMLEDILNNVNESQ